MRRYGALILFIFTIGFIYYIYQGIEVSPQPKVVDEYYEDIKEELCKFTGGVLTRNYNTEVIFENTDRNLLNLGGITCNVADRLKRVKLNYSYKIEYSVDMCQDGIIDTTDNGTLRITAIVKPHLVEGGLQNVNVKYLGDCYQPSPREGEFIDSLDYSYKEKLLSNPDIVEDQIMVLLNNNGKLRRNNVQLDVILP